MTPKKMIMMTTMTKEEALAKLDALAGIHQKALHHLEAIGHAHALISAGCRFHMNRCTEGWRVSVEHRTFSDIEHGDEATGCLAVTVPLSAESDDPPKPRMPHVKYDWTREELIALCDRGVVAHDKWRNRDAPESQKKLGAARQALRAGRSFRVLVPEDGGSCVTDERTVWIEVDDATYYLPTPARIEEADGNDWY